MRKTKWFNIYDKSKTFRSGRLKPKTLEEAFDKSIEKWAITIDGYTVGNAVRECGLCNLFYENSCDECPIQKDTDSDLCVGNSPLNEFDDCFYFDGDRDEEKCKKKWAEAERKYLIRLQKKYCKKGK